MVSGNALIRCNTCDHGCCVKTEGSRNQSREENVVTLSCDHFSMRISIHTTKNYISWIIGPRDRVSFYLYATCKNCNKIHNCEITCEGFETARKSINYNCCENIISFDYNIIQSLLDCKMMDSIKSFLPLSFLIPSNVITRIEDN